MSTSGPTRREVLAGAGLALAGPALAGRADIGTGGQSGGGGVTVVLQDTRVVLPDDVRRRLAANGACVIPLDEDPVRMWRGEQASLLGSRRTRLLGATLWPQFLLVRGLAEESGRRVRYQRLDAASGAIVWLIA